MEANSRRTVDGDALLRSPTTTLSEPFVRHDPAWLGGD